MSRAKFVKDELGAIPHNPRNAWSYVNHDEKLIVFGAWSHEENRGDQLIFSRGWRRDANNRRTASYGPSIRHIEHILEEGYKLYTFRQHAVLGTESGVPRIRDFDRELNEKQLIERGQCFYAVDLDQAVQSVSALRNNEIFEEGRAFEVIQTAYERNPDARKKCLKHYGAACAVCKFDFDLIYGDISNGFIHVHHLVEVSSRKGTYQVDPIADLRPVCPNCHAMLHKQSPPLEIDELKNKMQAQVGNLQ